MPNYLEQYFNNLANAFKRANQGTANEVLRKLIHKHLKKNSGEVKVSWTDQKCNELDEDFIEYQCLYLPDILKTLTSSKPHLEAYLEDNDEILPTDINDALECWKK